MTPMSMTYHHHVMASLRREADTERVRRTIVRTRDDSPRRRLGSRLAVRAAERRIASA